MYILEQVLNGICQGSIYALIAIGYAFIYGIVGLVTFSYGEVAMVGAFTAYYAFSLFGKNLAVGLLAGFAGGVVAGMFIYRFCYERFLLSPKHIAMICTVAMSTLLKGLAQIFIGTEVKPMPVPMQGKFVALGSFRITYIQIVVIITVILLASGLTLFTKRTQVGMQLRAVSQDKKAASLVGIDVKRMTFLGNCIGCGFGGVAGLLLALYYSNISALLGNSVGFKAFSAVVLGGLSNVGGAAVGGLLIGLLENIGIIFFPANYRDTIAFVFMVVVLIFLPQGLGTKKGERT